MAGEGRIDALRLAGKERTTAMNPKDSPLFEEQRQNQYEGAREGRNDPAPLPPRAPPTPRSMGSSAQIHPSLAPFLNFEQPSTRFQPPALPRAPLALRGNAEQTHDAVGYRPKACPQLAASGLWSSPQRPCLGLARHRRRGETKKSEQERTAEWLGNGGQSGPGVDRRVRKGARGKTKGTESFRFPGFPSQWFYRLSAYPHLV